MAASLAHSASARAGLGLAPSQSLGTRLQPQRQAAALPTSGKTQRRRAVVVRAELETQSIGLARSGALQGGQWLSCTTRHVRIYVGYVDPATMAMDQSQADKLSLMLDPDNEFLWPDDKVAKVYEKFTELVDGYAGADLTEYTLRLIGSDLEHYIRSLLLAGEIKYNLDCRVLNFSMGKPRYEGIDV